MIAPPRRNRHYIAQDVLSIAKRTYNGVRYQSALEARYAARLDFEVRAGELAAWARPPKFELACNGKVVGNYRPDFKLIREKPGPGICTISPYVGKYVELKSRGTDTEASRLRRRVFRACWPGVELVLVTLERGMFREIPDPTLRKIG